MAHEAILQMQGIRKTFGPVVALDNVDLELKKGRNSGTVLGRQRGG